MSKHRRHDTAADVTGASDPESIPSTLDPNLDTEAFDLEDEIDEIDRENHDPVEQDNPEDEIFADVQRAAEAMPADTPADRADQTDKRMEKPPRAADLDLDEE
ncbi:hypothetical protein [Cupriavidus plantarum]|uniref:Uncharacterized protein n=1 Tax=Cupriavidus plantarum TaxID=942865 RepID=A0A316ESD1_9BURK|nr:hypothetical protein [Cupriavidus plantarum]NYI01899.1 hypothetical protein [Cupriavidus plantarum]PWK34032.1 hypothetical protein C7419_103351 [Cupriavidus plantarum]RLK31560.1 hypothetical protein C7417_4537 [Cupriavidus plantarum]CAG2147301.1 hypothetical protein LMG26296_04072 [Cupriavidus plantarum]SMR85597.1 hypothetical protein SAMN05421735_4404 [Cupriavidus plantarum]